MDTSKLVSRAVIVAILVALAAASTVYFLHGWFHEVFAQAPVADAIGTAVVVLMSFLAQRLVSMAFYRDLMLGVSNAASEQQENLDNLRSKNEEVASELRQIRDFNELVRGHLRSIHEGTEKAAYDIVERLQTIDAVVTQLDRFVAGSSDETAVLARSSEARIADNQTLIGRMGGYVQKRLRDTQDDHARVTRVVQETRELGSVVDLIKHVAGQTNLLALNASIEAARAGENGRGFSVVADEVQRLAGETKTAADKISEGIRYLADSICQQFEDKLSCTSQEGEKEMLERFSGQLDELGKSYETMMRHELNILDEVKQSSARLMQMFLDAQANVQFQDVSRQQIEHVLHALDQLDEHAKAMADRLGCGETSEVPFMPIAARLNEFYDRYVMESQRTTHAASLRPGSKQQPVASSRVELF